MSVYERTYPCQNWRGDVVAVFSREGLLVNQVRYDSYGMPFAIPSIDFNGDGLHDLIDFFIWFEAYDFETTNPTGPRRRWADVNFDDKVDLVDFFAFQGEVDTAVELGRGKLGYPSGRAHGHVRRGHAGAELAAELVIGAPGTYHMRHRVYQADEGRWTRRDPIGYHDGMNLYEYRMSSGLSARLTASDTVAGAGAAGSAEGRAAGGKDARDPSSNGSQPRKLSDGPKGDLIPVVDDPRAAQKKPWMYKKMESTIGAAWSKTVVKCGGDQRFSFVRWDRVDNIITRLARLKESGCCVEYFEISAHHNGVTFSCKDDAVDNHTFAQAIKLCPSGRVDLEVCNGCNLASMILKANGNDQQSNVKIRCTEHHNIDWAYIGIDFSIFNPTSFDRVLPMNRSCYGSCSTIVPY